MQAANRWTLFLFAGDAAFSKVLVNEIKNERQRMASIPEPSDGWSLKQDGTNCLLNKIIDNDQWVHQFLNLWKIMQMEEKNFKRSFWYTCMNVWTINLLNVEYFN